MLKYRLITGSLLVIFLILLATCDQRFTGAESPLARGLLLLIAACLLAVPLLALEVTVILRRLGNRASGWVAVVGSSALCFTMWWSVDPASSDSTLLQQLPMLTLAVVVALSFIDACGGRRTQGILMEVTGTLFAVIYAGGLMGFWLMLRQEVGAWVIMGAILTVKMADIGAYTVGCSIGRTRLIPWLSPKKTWEGLIGGIVFATVTGGVMAAATANLTDDAHTISIAQGVLFGFFAAWTGLFGDLVASAMKRDARIKDSGGMLPGLGGIVDTLDSLLLSAPLAWCLLG
ncbi:MAG: CDP-archaeol synthase [Planctomycetota bacterium]|nr:CDP-archaeol synthase [Planctomycetota bacterium]